MTNSEILYEMYYSLKKEKEELCEILKKNLSRITEIDKFLTTIKQKRNFDYDVFSPRTKESLCREEIQQMEEEKICLETDNQNHYRKINKFTAYIAGVESVLGVSDINKSLHILDIQEKERQRIARDLHDSSLQNLAHLVHKVELSSMFIDQDPLRAKLELATVNKNLKLIIKDIRNTVFDLRPMTFDDLGLEEAFNRLFINLKEECNFDFHIDIDNIEIDNNLILMTIFRVVHEGCLNSIRHSGGNKLYISVKYKDNLCKVVIEDNGSGFDVNTVIEQKGKHFGLLIMKERVELLGGNINFESQFGKGTRICINIPVAKFEGGIK